MDTASVIGAVHSFFIKVKRLLATSICCMCVDKLSHKSTILPTTHAEPPYALMNGHHSLPNNVRSSPRDTHDDVIVTSSEHRRPPEQETVARPKTDLSQTEDDRPSLATSRSQSTWTEYDHRQQQYNRHCHLSDNAVTTQSTPSCDVIHPSAEIPAHYSISSSMSSAASSSFMTSSLDVDDDVIDDATLSVRQPSGTGSASVRAHARLSAIVSQLLGLAIDDNDERQAAVDVDRLLRRVLPEPETVSRTLAGSLFELLDQAIAECGLDTAIRVLLEALTPSTGGGHVGHVIDLLGAVRTLLRLVTSLDGDESETADCSCDVMRSDDAAELDVQLTSASDCVTDDVTMARRLRCHSAGRQHFRLSACRDDDSDVDVHAPALSVRLSGWCLCDRRRTAVLGQLLASTRCVYELALVKTNLDRRLCRWLAETLRSNTSLIRLDLRLNSLAGSTSSSSSSSNGGGGCSSCFNRSVS